MKKKIKIIISGCKGRMGKKLILEIKKSKYFELIGLTDKNAKGKINNINIDTNNSDLIKKTDIIIDFSRPKASIELINIAKKFKKKVVIGTTGFNEEKIAKVQKMLQAKSGVSLRLVPNFSIGAILMMRFAKAATKFYDSAEIIEYHHPNKIDAPSGTAVRTAQIIAEERKANNLSNNPDATISEIPGARGSKIDGIPVHAVRMQGLVAHQEVVFGSLGETLTIRHDSFDRESFMPGVLLAIRNIAKKPGLTIGIDDLIN